MKLRTARLVGEGANEGALGYVIEIYPNGKYEVEFLDARGNWFAQSDESRNTPQGLCSAAQGCPR